MGIEYRKTAFAVFTVDLAYGTDGGLITESRLNARASMHVDNLTLWKSGQAEAHRRAAIYRGIEDGKAGSPANRYQVNAGKPADAQSMDAQHFGMKAAAQRLSWLPVGWCVAMWKEGEKGTARLPGSAVSYTPRCSMPRATSAPAARDLIGGGSSSGSASGSNSASAAALPPAPHPQQPMQQHQPEDEVRRVAFDALRRMKTTDPAGAAAIAQVLGEVRTGLVNEVLGDHAKLTEQLLNMQQFLGADEGRDNEADESAKRRKVA